MLHRHHSGFNEYYGSAVMPRAQNAMKKLIRYILREADPRERMTYGNKGEKMSQEKKIRLGWIRGMVVIIVSYIIGDLIAIPFHYVFADEKNG